jgi:Transcriptional regulators
MSGHGWSTSFWIMAVDRNSRTPPWRQIADSLRTQIENGTIPPGGRIPSTVELEAQWEVARETIRKAINHLKNEGIVEGVQGMGIYVTENSTPPADQ